MSCLREKTTSGSYADGLEGPGSELSILLCSMLYDEAVKREAEYARSASSSSNPSLELVKYKCGVLIR